MCIRDSFLFYLAKELIPPSSDIHLLLAEGNDCAKPSCSKGRRRLLYGIIFALCHFRSLTASSSIPCFLYRICVHCRIDFFTISPFALWYHFCTIPCFSLWYLYFSKQTPPRTRVYHPPSGRHAMWCLYVIGRDSWVRGMSHVWARWTFCHGVGVGTSICSVAPRWCIFGSSLP